MKKVIFTLLIVMLLFVVGCSSEREVNSTLTESTVNGAKKVIELLNDYKKFEIDGEDLAEKLKDIEVRIKNESDDLDNSYVATVIGLVRGELKLSLIDKEGLFTEPTPFDVDHAIETMENTLYVH